MDDLPGSPDAAFIGVIRNLTVDIVRDLVARKSGGAICYATGFIETGEDGLELQKQLLEASGDMPLIGPNCYGLLNYISGAMLWHKRDFISEVSFIDSLLIVKLEID